MIHTALETTSRLPPVLASAANARHIVRDVLLHAGVDRWPIIDTAMLLVSEMVTNAVVHARTPVEVRVVVGNDVVRVEARDASTSPLERHRLGPAATSGRGLALIEQLATTWGSTTEAEGKTVWFELHGDLTDDTTAAADPALPLRPLPAEETDQIERRRREMGVSPMQLWLDYLAVGGRASWGTVQRFLHGSTQLPATELDRLVQALDDRLAARPEGPAVERTAVGHEQSPA
jgi:anti-sigma regulatory factor (Ser/Thr protein kinase)